MHLCHPFHREVTIAKCDLDHKLQGKGNVWQVLWDNKVTHRESPHITENATTKDLAIHNADFLMKCFMEAPSL